MEDNSATHWQRWQVILLRLQKDALWWKQQATEFCFLLDYLWHISGFFFLVCLSGSVLYACLPCPSFKKQSIPCKGRLVLVSGCLRPLFCCGWQHMTSRAKWEAGEGVRSGSPFLELDTNLALRKKRGEAEFRNSSGSRIRLAGYLVQERQVKLSQ